MIFPMNAFDFVLSMPLMLVVMLFAAQSVAANVLNECHKKCHEQENLRTACKLEHKCDKFLPDLGAFISCLKPCRQIPSNCFRRCAFHTDDISDKCHQQCATATQDGDDDTSGDQCYNGCYDNLINEAMDKLYRKRP